MKKVRQSSMKTVFLSLVLLSSLYTSAQHIESKGIGTGDKWGVYLGNPLHFNGLRITLMSVKYYNSPYVINGASIGLILWDSINNGASIGIIANLAHHNGNGIAIGTIACARKKMNGLLIGGMWSVSDTANGVQIGITNICNKKLNGVAFGVGIGSSNIDSNKLIFNGLGIASEMSTNQLNGIGLTIVGLIANDVNGLTVGGFVKSEKQNGVSIGLLNKTKKLHGVQLGLLNYAGNNPKALRWLPLINAHIGKA